MREEKVVAEPSGVLCRNMISHRNPFRFGKGKRKKRDTEYDEEV